MSDSNSELPSDLSGLNESITFTPITVSAVSFPDCSHKGNGCKGFSKKMHRKICSIEKKMYLCSPNSIGTRLRPKNDLGLIR